MLLEALNWFPVFNVLRVISAGEQHMPLRLCKPSEESKVKMSRPASARPRNEDDSFSINETNSVRPALMKL